MGARFYAPDPAVPLTDSEKQRLHHLEAQKREQLAQPAATSTEDRPTELSTEYQQTVPAPTVSTTETSTTSSRANRLRGTTLLVAAACLIVGGALGWLVAQGTVGQPSAASQTEGLPPELLRPATEEDALDVVDDTIDPGSTRFVATIDGVDVYLGTSRGQSQVCVLAYRAGIPTSIGCSPWSAGSSMGSGITEDLTIAVGTDAYPDSDAERIPLSESATAIRGPLGP